MFNIGFSELIVIFIIALIFLGPEKLPGLAKTLGKISRDLKRATNEFGDTIQREVDEIKDLDKDIKEDVKKATEIQILPDAHSVASKETLNKDEKNEPS